MKSEQLLSSIVKFENEWSFTATPPYNKWRGDRQVYILTISLFLVIMRRVVEIPYGRFGTTYRSDVEGVE
jgi:hypothetical protein